MGMLARILILLGVLLIPAPAAWALELFGVDLASTDRDALRAAVKQAGVELIREGGDERFFDVYDSAAVLAGSSRLYLGFVRADQRFAFAEYEFDGIDTSAMRERLSARYGKPEVGGGRYLSDRSYAWQQDGIEIRLQSDWYRYKVRLSYTHPANLTQLLREKAAVAAGDAEVVEVTFF